MTSQNPKAAIFDMDGVIVVNMHIHEQAFFEFGKRYGKNVDHEFFVTQITGSTNEKIMPKIFGPISDEEIKAYSLEKEALFREIYKPQLKLTEGLAEFLDYLYAKNIKMAIASNAPKENIDFIVEGLKLEKYFPVCLNGNSVANPKPAPDMFLKAAELLGETPANSIVFEDAPGGIRAAHEAGMRSVGVLTSHTKEELSYASWFIEDFTNPVLKNIF